MSAPTVRTATKLQHLQSQSVPIIFPEVKGLPPDSSYLKGAKGPSFVLRNLKSGVIFSGAIGSVHVK
jgi:hypothetical protein